MVRHAIGCAARRAALDARSIRELMGHGGDETRIRVSPCPMSATGMATGASEGSC